MVGSIVPVGQPMVRKWEKISVLSSLARQSDFRVSNPIPLWLFYIYHVVMIGKHVNVAPECGGGLN